MLAMFDTLPTAHNLGCRQFLQQAWYDTLPVSQSQATGHTLRIPPASGYFSSLGDQDAGKGEQQQKVDKPTFVLLSENTARRPMLMQHAT